MNKEQPTRDVRFLHSLAATLTRSYQSMQSINIASPVLINFILFLYFIVIPFCLVDKKEEYHLALIVATIGFASINAGLLIKVERGNQFARIVLATPNIWWNRVAIVSAILFLAYDLSRIIQFLLDGVTQAAYYKDYDKKQGQHLYLLPFWIGLAFCKYYFYSIIIASSKKIFWAIFAISLLAAIPGRVRFELVSIVIFFGAYGSLVGHIKWKPHHLFAGATMAPILIFLLLIKRDIVGDASFFEIWHLVFDRLMILWREGGLLREFLVSLESPATFEIFNRVVQDNFVRPENGVIRVFFNFIPREIWLEKPLPMQIELARAYNPSGFASGGGVFAGFYGDAYANAGITGVILLPFLVGLLLNIAHRNAIHNPLNNSAAVGFYALLLVYFANAYRGYFSDMTWQVVFLYTVFFCLNKFNAILNQPRH